MNDDVIFNDLKEIFHIINDASKPARTDVATVVQGADGLTLQGAELTNYPQAAVVVPQHLNGSSVEASYTCPVTGEEVRFTINIGNGLQAGDKVIVVKDKGGQKLTVVGRVNDDT